MSRLGIIKSSMHGEGCRSNQLIDEFVRQSLLKWRNTEVLTWDLTTATALSASYAVICPTTDKLQQADYLALALCSEDYGCLKQWLEHLPYNQNLEKIPLFIFISGENEAVNLVAKAWLAAQLPSVGLSTPVYIESNGSKQSLEVAYRQITRLMAC
ncbi:hypothetical protein [Testudinibacter sp. TR-2022]|uniref:hypothetical protein n=1 Tax=Testudinibacter sp. TR-2022 TaxID=2585029 RepID=UPI00111980A1|nr:hypothetical protein [Testudinibacter sp. TR-2022]TNH06125.1 hypothetical protein FHQ30_09040 [Pasteurellaceae bacterium Phil11]TNH21453.1 hypothetical protein FHQ29_09885 [Testudinibacter sp. TR-2022]TNH25382.1 hypothetical protein FHQ27_09110 [Testudinibacter sp. TR-2022]